MDIEVLWKPEYSVGQAEIDRQHRYLFELWGMLDSVKGLSENRRSKEQALMALFDYIEIHFRDEEQYLQAHPEFAAHRKIHKDFVKQTRVFLEEFHLDELNLNKVVDYLCGWLLHHIVETDGRYFRELREMGLLTE